MSDFWPTREIEDMDPDARKAWGDLFAAAARLVEDYGHGLDSLGDELRAMTPGQVVSLAIAGIAATANLARLGAPNASREQILEFLRTNAAALRG